MKYGMDFVDEKVANFYKTYIKQADFRSEPIASLIDQISKSPKKEGILEIGIGDGLLATEILKTVNGIRLYAGIEPASAMLEPEVKTFKNFQLFTEPFEQFASEKQFDFIIMKYVIHDYPDVNQKWCEKIAKLLAKNGSLLMLDAFKSTEEETQKHLEYYIKLANQVKAASPEESVAREKWISHLKQEYAGYIALDQQKNILRSVGLEPEIVKKINNEALIKASRNQAR